MSSFNIIPATTIYSKVLQSRSLNIVTNLFTVQLLITLHLSPTIKTVTIYTTSYYIAFVSHYKDCNYLCCRLQCGLIRGTSLVIYIVIFKNTKHKQTIQSMVAWTRLSIMYLFLTWLYTENYFTLSWLFARTTDGRIWILYAISFYKLLSLK